MRTLNEKEIQVVAGAGVAADQGAQVAGSIGAFIDGILGIFGFKFNLEKILGAVGGFIGGIVDAVKAGK